MKYELMDLGKPESNVYSTAWIVTPSGNFMIKGELLELQRKLNEFARKGYFYGKRRQYKNGTQVSSYFISSGVRITQKKFGKRVKYEFKDVRFGFVWMQVRRLPVYWPKQIHSDIVHHLLVAADYLDEGGFTSAATFLRHSVIDNSVPAVFSYSYAETPLNRIRPRNAILGDEAMADADFMSEIERQSEM